MTMVRKQNKLKAELIKSTDGATGRAYAAKRGWREDTKPYASTAEPRLQPHVISHLEADP